MSTARTQSAGNLTKIGIALHDFHDDKGRFPRDLRRGNGNPLLSWRVAILPYIKQQQLYNQFKLDEPWDSAHNLPLLKKMPQTYLLPIHQSQSELGRGLTYYQGFDGPGAFFDSKLSQPLRVTDIQDGTYCTILVVEAAEPVPWTKPADIEYDPTRPIPLRGHYGTLVNVLYCNARVRLININQANFEQKMHAAIGYNDRVQLEID